MAALALALTGCASAREPSETPDGSALDVAALVRQNAADAAGALQGGATAARLEQMWGEAIEAEDEAHRTVPSTTAAKPPLLLAAAAATDAAQALALRRPAEARAHLAGGADAARPGRRRADKPRPRARRRRRTPARAPRGLRCTGAP